MLKDMNLEQYIVELASSSPAPGGGSVAALSGAQGAALCAMVCGLTVGKEKYAEFWSLCEEVKNAADGLAKDFVALVDKDTEAYLEVAAALKMPKATAEEKAARSKAIADSTITAIAVPIETMEKGLETLEQLKKLKGRSNPNAASDLGVAASCLLTCVKGARLNVLINLPGVKDETKRAEYKTLADDILSKAQILSEVYND